MITESFDREAPAIISPVSLENRPQADICIITFSSKIEQYALERKCDSSQFSIFSRGATKQHSRLCDQKVMGGCAIT